MEQKVIPIILNGKDSVERMKKKLRTGWKQGFKSCSTATATKPTSPRWRSFTITASTTPC